MSCENLYSILEILWETSIWVYFWKNRYIYNNGQAAQNALKNFLKTEKCDLTLKKHVGRIGCVNTLAQLGATDLAIDVHMNWRSQSMRKYYLRDFIATNENSPAHLLAKAAESDKLNELQSSIFPT